MRFFAGMHVPRCHVNTTLSNTIFSRKYQLFACWLKMFFWIRVAKSMLSVHLVLEICGLKVVVSFNFAPSAPHVKRRVKSCEPRAAAANGGSTWSVQVEILAYGIQPESWVSEVHVLAFFYLLSFCLPQKCQTIVQCKKLLNTKLLMTNFQRIIFRHLDTAFNLATFCSTSWYGW